MQHIIIIVVLLLTICAPSTTLATKTTTTNPNEKVGDARRGTSYQCGEEPFPPLCTGYIYSGMHFPFCLVPDGATYIKALSNPIAINFRDSDDCTGNPDSFTFVIYSGSQNGITCMQNPPGNILVEERMLGGTATTVIEWSAVTINNPEYPGKVFRVGTIQAWLFPNGTFGVVYHLTGAFYGNTMQICNGYGHCQIIFSGSDNFRLTGEAYLVYPNSICTSRSQTPDYSIVPWTTAPDTCLLDYTDRDFADYALLGFLVDDGPDNSYDYDADAQIYYDDIFSICPVDNHYDRIHAPRSESPSSSPTPTRGYYYEGGGGGGGGGGGAPTAVPESASPTIIPESRSPSVTPTSSPNITAPPSLSPLPSPSPSTPLLDYLFCDEPYYQDACCTGTFDIGYEFPFACENQTSASAVTAAYLVFGDEPACGGDSAILQYLFSLGDEFFEANLVNKGGIGVHYGVMLAGETERITMVEFSGITFIPPFEFDHERRSGGAFSIKVGTFQVFLFRNGTIGLVYHLTGDWFGLHGAFCYDPFQCEYFSGGPPFGPDIEATSFLRTSEAYLAVPDSALLGENCTSIANYTTVIWSNPPDFCANPVREYEDFFDSSEDMPINDENWDNYLYYDGNDDDYFFDGNVPYTPLSICPADHSIKEGTDAFEWPFLEYENCTPDDEKKKRSNQRRCRRRRDGERQDQDEDPESESESISDSTTLLLLDTPSNQTQQKQQQQQRRGGPDSQLYGCVSHAAPIGFHFPYGCNDFTQILACDSGNLYFGNGSEFFNCWDPASVFMLQAGGFFGLDNRGGIAVYHLYINKFSGDERKFEKITVIEWSGILVEREDCAFSKFGSAQIWLFKNGTIGTVYHATGDLLNLFSSVCRYLPRFEGRSPDYDCKAFLGGETGNMTLQDYPAFIYYPTVNASTATPTCFPVQDPVPWINPPNLCFNPNRHYLEDSEENHLVVVDERDYAYGPVGNVTYSLLKICPADRFRTHESASISPTESDTPQPTTTQSSSPTPSISASESVNPLEFYQECGDGPPGQNACCTDFFAIGYDFPFNCEARSTASAYVTGTVHFDNVSDCLGQYALYQVAHNDNSLVNKGGIGVHRNITLAGEDESVTMIEFSGQARREDVTDEHAGAVYNIKIGTFQVFLFRNGTFGLVYHLTGQSFPLYLQVCFGDNCEATISDGFDTFLRASEAYLLTPTGDIAYGVEDCTPGTPNYTVTIWTNPPDFCSNPTKSLPEDEDSSGVNHIDEEDRDTLLYYNNDGNDYDYEYDDATLFEKNLPYTPLSICPADHTVTEGPHPFAWPFIQYADCEPDDERRRSQGIGSATATTMIPKDRRGINDIQEPFCYSDFIRIGFDFPFGCDRYRELWVCDSGSIHFGSEPGDCFDFRSVFFVNIDIWGLDNDGGIAVYHFLMNRFSGDGSYQKITVIEWSGILVPRRDYLAYSKFGTAQAWLFPNGTIGVVFHFTGEMLYVEGVVCSFYGDCNWGYLTGNGNNSVHTSPAFLYHRSANISHITPTCFPLAHPVPWHNPPTSCLNPRRKFDEDSQDGHIPVDDAPDYYDSAGPPVGNTTYELLAICPADRFRTRAQLVSHNQSASHSEHASPSGHETATESETPLPVVISKKVAAAVTGSVAGGMMGAIFIFVMVFIFI
jgi:hypothetical protein